MYTVGYMEVFSNLCSVLYFFYFCNVCICNSVLCILFILIQHFFSVMIIMKFVLFFFIAEMENLADFECGSFHRQRVAHGDEPELSGTSHKVMLALMKTDALLHR